MLKSDPYRAAVLALLVAAGAFGLSLLFDESGNGEGWTEGTQGVANVCWILMILSIAIAVVLAIVGVVRGGRSRG